MKFSEMVENSRLDIALEEAIQTTIQDLSEKLSPTDAIKELSSMTKDLDSVSKVSTLIKNVNKFLGLKMTDQPKLHSAFDKLELQTDIFRALLLKIRKESHIPVIDDIGSLIDKLEATFTRHFTIMTKNVPVK